MKKILAVLTALTILFSFTACNSSDETDEIVTTTANESFSDYETDTDGVTATTDAAETTDLTDVSVTNAEAESTTNADGGESATSVPENTTAAAVSAVSSDPSKWSKEEIVDFYKKAAAKSTSARSTQTMEMTEIVANDGNGFLGTFIEWVTPIFKAALKKNSTEYDGITGGYDKLVPSDVKTAKAYKSGEYTVIEMTMYEQTDGIHGVNTEGTVGHAISVVGDISVVQEELPQFFIDFDNATLKLHYTKPTLKVKINKNGVIEKGTWSYVLDVELENLYIEAKKFPIKVTVDNGYGSVDYKVTVGGGF